MAKSRKKNKKVVIPDLNEAISKITFEPYLFGKAESKLHDIKNDKPIFSFQYASLQNKEFCFDSKLIDGVGDYVALIDGLKRIALVTYDNMRTNHRYHFHVVDPKTTNLKPSHLLKILGGTDSEQLPSLYQFKVFSASRVIGFIYSKVFYLIYFDVDHNNYKRK